MRLGDSRDIFLRLLLFAPFVKGSMFYKGLPLLGGLPFTFLIWPGVLSKESKSSLVREVGMRTLKLKCPDCPLPEYSRQSRHFYSGPSPNVATCLPDRNTQNLHEM